MPCTVVNSQSNLQARLPQLPATLPKTQADWTAFLQIVQQWGQALQQQPPVPNVIPAEFQTFSVAAGPAVLAALLASSCTPAIDTTDTYYGGASLGVTGISSGGFIAFAGNPISISAATRWFCSFAILAPSGCTGSLSVATASGTITETFVVPASASWQQVWGLFDLTKFPDVKATWQITFTSTASVAIDGMQMNAVGKVLAFLPKFSGTKMLTGAAGYAQNLDGVADGSTYWRSFATHFDGAGTRRIDPSAGGIAGKGSTPPIVPDVGFSWTTTSGQVTITWPAFTIYRPDGTTTSISAGAGTTITGLTNGTAYTVYPYIVDGATTVSFSTGAAGAAGSPAMAYAGGSGPGAAIAYSNAHIPLNGFQVTPSASGGGGGGNKLGCLHPSTLVETFDGRILRARDVRYDSLIGPSGPVRVTSIHRSICSDWVRVRLNNGETCTVTLEHVFIRPDDTLVHAREMLIGEILKGRDCYVQVRSMALISEPVDMVSINVEPPHLYFLAGALSHNGNPKP